VKMLVRHVICLSGLLGIFEFEKASYVFGCSFLDPCAFYSRSYYAFFWCDLCNLLSMLLVRVLIMHAVINLTLYHLGTMLMLS